MSEAIKDAGREDRERLPETPGAVNGGRAVLDRATEAPNGNGVATHVTELVEDTDSGTVFSWPWLERAHAHKDAAPNSRRDSLRRRLLAGADVLGLTAAFLLVRLIAPAPGVTDDERVVMIVVLPLWVLLNKLLRLYDRDASLFHKSTLNELPRIFQSVALGAALIYMFSEPLFGFQTLRLQTALFVGFALMLLPILRASARAIVTSRFPTERCLLIGSGPAADLVARKVLAHPEYGIQIVGTADLIEDRDRPHEGHLPLLGDITELGRIRREHEIERVVIAFSPALSHVHLMDVAQACKRLNLKVSIVPRFFEVVGKSVDVDEVEGMTLLGLSGLERTGSSLMLKRAMDVIGASIGLILLSPLFALLAIAIKLDSHGPVLFRQRRIGKDDHPFGLLKFRTMVADADARKEELLELNEVEGPMFKIADDPRITRVGRYLRRLSLDELPQLWNVLIGEMSLVGPRPLVPDEADHVSGWNHRARLDQPPGLTGPWQVMGRNSIPFEDMVKLDYLYLADWSLWNDLKLIARTIPVVLTRKGH